MRRGLPASKRLEAEGVLIATSQCMALERWLLLLQLLHVSWRISVRINLPKI